MKIRIFILLGLFISLTLQITHIRNDAIYGRHLRVSAFHHPPFFMVTQGQDGKPTYSGYCFNILDWMVQHYQLNITFVPLNQSEIAEYGITQAIINQLIKKNEVDIIPMVLTPTPNRARFMDFTTPLLIDRGRFMLRYPEEESRLAAVLQPFSLLTWSLLIITIFTLVVVMVLSTLYQRFRNKSKKPFSVWELFGRYTLFILGLLTGQGFYMPDNFLIFRRIPIMVWSLIAVVIANAYSGTLTSFLTVPKLKPTISSIKELATSEDYKLTLEINTADADKFLAATSGYGKILGDSLRENPHLLFHDYNGSIENVLNHNAVYLRVGIEVLNRVYADMKANNGKCRLTASKPFGDVRFLSFGLKKDQHYNNAFNEGLSRLRESGLLTHWFNQYIPKIDKCFVGIRHVAKVDNSKVKALNIHDATSLFLVFSAGLSVSLLAFLGELLFRHFAKANK